jgi:hypothetical protein
MMRPAPLPSAGPSAFGRPSAGVDSRHRPTIEEEMMAPTELLDPVLETPESPVTPEEEPPSPDQPDEVPGEDTPEEGGGDEGEGSDAPSLS